MTPEIFALLFITFITGACFGVIIVIWRLAFEERENERELEKRRKKWVDAQMYREKWNEDHGYKSGKME